MTWTPTNNVEQERFDKLRRIAERGISAYPQRVERTHTNSRAIELFAEHEAANASNPEAAPLSATLCGRIRSIRGQGKVSFVDIEDGTGKIQLLIRKDIVGDDTYDLLKKDIDLFDFVQVSGNLIRSRTGEISLEVRALTLLAKALSPLPVIREAEVDGKTVQYGSFTNTEERYRQRYADLAVNADVREVFRTRAKIISAVRRFLEDEGYLEVETPILQPIYGGAAARPFTTHHNELDEDVFLRISFELYLKRLLVGGYDGVFEIGRDFRNESVSFKHNPEFTMLEFYVAYIDYHGAMDIVERLILYTTEKATGSTTITFKGNEITLTRPFHRVTMRSAIREASGIDYMDFPTAPELYAKMQSIGATKDVRPDTPWGKLVEHLFGEYVEPNLIQPTFIMDYPRDISPFAKPVPGDDKHVERFELYIGGMELGNAFTELNDPLDQEQRFLDIAKLFRAEDDDAAPIDEDYLRALRYGMPPAGGVGIGMDRLAMLLTNRDSIREVLLFPHMRQLKQGEQAE
jgi:lysyl-tRNA synthetase, class II